MSPNNSMQWTALRVAADAGRQAALAATAKARTHVSNDENKELVLQYYEEVAYRRGGC